MSRALVFLFICLFCGARAFAPPPASSSPSPMKLLQGNSVRVVKQMQVLQLRAAEPQKEQPSTGQTGSEPPGGAGQGGVSDAMKRKMLNEMRSQGADPNVSTGNPILLVAAVVAVLVVLGGQGIFY